MRVDLYTKSILTIIAICLVWLCVRNASVSSVVQAQGDRVPGSDQHVVISGWVGGDGVVRKLPVPPTTAGRDAPLPVVTR